MKTPEHHWPNDETKGVQTRKLFSHKPGERFVYNGSLFTVVVLSNSLLMGLVHSGVNGEALDRMRELFLAVDQHGVLNVFNREENVVTISSFPDFGSYYKKLPDGVEDADQILCTPGYGAREQAQYDQRRRRLNPSELG